MKYIIGLVVVLLILSVAGYLVYSNNKNLAEAQAGLSEAQLNQQQIQGYLANMPDPQSCNILLDKNCMKSKGVDFSGIFSAVFGAI